MLLALLLLVAPATAQRGWRNGNWIGGANAPEDVKAQWAARPPMFGPAPLANRRPVTDAPGQLAKPRTPAPLGEPLWPFPAIRYDADVVTGLALNYREFSHRAFVGTLRRAGYRGDVTIITEPRNKLQRGCEAYLRKSGVVAYGLVPDCSQSSGSNIKHKTCKWREGQPPLPLAIIRHALYLAIAKTYSPTSMFYVADYRDTFFQVCLRRPSFNLARQEDFSRRRLDSRFANAGGSVCTRHRAEGAAARGHGVIGGG